MSSLRSLRLTTVAVVAAMFAGCASDVTSPAPAPPNTSLLGGVVGTVTGLLVPVDMLARTTPLARSITVTKTIGSEGGSFAIPAAGLRVTVPAGAVRSPVTFTVTAPAGDDVRYDFGPHGARFAKPLTVRQSLVGTNASSASRIEAGYYASDDLVNSLLNTALVNELLGVVINASGSEATFDVSHFSGYMLSTGRSY